MLYSRVCHSFLWIAGLAGVGVRGRVRPLDVMTKDRGRKQMMLTLGIESLESDCEVTVDLATGP